MSHILEELPETLDETYERILQEIPKANRVHAHRLLQCLTVAARPLRVQELAEVLAVDFNAAGGIPQLNEDWRWKDQEQAVLTACSSLIAVVNFQNSFMVQFSHYSVKEFLASDRLAAANFDILRFHHIRPEPAHTIMAQACVGVLLRLTQPINNEAKMRFPLADYAAKHFADHADFGNVVSRITKAIDELLDEDKPHFAAWMSYISSSWWSKKHSGLSKASPLYHVAELGFRGLVRYLVLKRPQDVIVRGGVHGTPMHAALCRRHFQVFELLLPRCMDPDIRDSSGQTLLHVAVVTGLVEVVQLIIGRGADVNAEDSDGWPPLHRIINTMPQFDDRNLDHNSEVEAKDNEHVTPLFYAGRNGQLASIGYSDIIRLLLEHGADIQVTNGEHNTPLHLAASLGKLSAVQLLIEKGAILHMPGKFGRTPLHFASFGGYPDIIRLLLERGADIQATDDEHNTPLHLAASLGKLSAVQLHQEDDHLVSAFPLVFTGFQVSGNLEILKLGNPLYNIHNRTILLTSQELVSMMIYIVVYEE